MARQFADAFPKVELLRFRAFPPELEGFYTGPFHTIAYAGAVDDLIANDLLLPEMVPPGRKELRWYREPGEPHWKSKRRARGRIQVEVDKLPGPPPALAGFGTDRWPFFDSHRAAREYCQDVLDFAEGFVESCEGRLQTMGLRITLRIVLRWPRSHPIIAANSSK